MIVTSDHDSDALNDDVQDVDLNEEQNRILNKTIKKVTEDIRNLSYNTAIACMMEFVNFFGRQSVRPKSAMKTFALLLSPFAPHISEELWSILGGTKTLAYEPWPKWDEGALKENVVTIPIQINGKVRGKIQISADADSAETEKTALNDTKIAALLEGKTVVKKIVILGKMVNIVVKG